jgi:hypothetical protein
MLRTATSTTTSASTEPGTVSRNWRNQLPIKNIGQYLGNKKRNNIRSRAWGDDARTTSGTVDYLQHHKLHDNYDDDYDDEEHLVTAMHHGQADDDYNDDNSESRSGDDDHLRNDVGDPTRTTVVATRDAEKNRINKLTDQHGMRNAVKQFFSTTTKNIRFGKRNESSEDVSKSSTTLAFTKEATTGTKSYYLETDRPSQVMTMQRKRASFTSSTTPTSSTTNTATPPVSPLQILMPEKKDDDGIGQPTSTSSPKGAQSDEVEQNEVDPLPKKIPAQDDNESNNSIHSMTLQQAIEPSTSDSVGSTQQNSYLSKFNVSNVTVKISNMNNAESDASVSEYLQLKLHGNESIPSRNGLASGHVAVKTPPEGDDNQQQVPHPRRKLSKRSPVSHNHANHNKTPSRTRSTKHRIRAPSTTENHEKSLKNQQMQLPQNSCLNSSSDTPPDAESDLPVRSLERSRQGSTRRLHTYLEPYNMQNTTPQLERKSSRNRSSRIFPTLDAESNSIRSTPILTSSLRRKTSLGRTMDDTKSISPRRVSSSLRERNKGVDMNVDPIISPPTPKRINSVDSSGSRIISESSRNRKCSNDQWQKKTNMKSATRSMASSSASASSAQVPINEPDLSKNFNESRGDKTGTGIEDQSKLYPSRSFTAGKSRQSSFRSTVSRSKSSDDALSLTGKKKAATTTTARTLNNGGKEYISKNLAMSTYRSPLDDEESIATARPGSGSNDAGKVHRSKRSYEKGTLGRSPGTSKSHRHGSQQLESPAHEKHRRNMSTARSRSPSVDQGHTHLVSPGGKPRGCLALSSLSPQSHSPSGDRHSSSQRSSRGQASPPTGEQQPQSPHCFLRKKIHHSRSQDLWLMQTPNSGPSKNTINAATVDLARRVPHSDGKVREKYKLGPAKGRCGIATSTPVKLDAPFWGNNTEDYKSQRRGTRSGHNNKKITSRSKHDPRQRSSSPERKQQQDDVIVPTSSNRHRSKSRTSGESMISFSYHRKDVLGQHLVSTKSKVPEATDESCSVCESTAES